MEVLEKGKTISIHAGRKFPIRKMIADGGTVVVVIWGIFAVLTLFFSHPWREMLPYFVGITLLLVVPLVYSVLIRQSRHYREILFDGERRVLSLRALWRWQKVSFDDIRGFQVNTYRFKRDVFLYRLDAVLASGKMLRLVLDVPDRDVLCSLARKVGDLVKKPLKVSD